MTTYAVVRCKQNPSHVIRLDIVKPGHEVWFVAPFDAECHECKTSQRFEIRDVIKDWEGPAPDETFQTHPAFTSKP